MKGNVLLPSAPASWYTTQATHARAEYKVSGPFEVDSSTERTAQKATDAQIADALELYVGNIAAVARSLNMRRATVRDRIGASPDLKAMLNDLREGILDDAEHNVFAKVREGGFEASKFVLSTLGRERGYSTRQELAGDEDMPVAINVTRKIVKASPEPEGDADG